MNGSMNTLQVTEIFKDLNVAKHLSYLHDKCVADPADKAQNNTNFVCISH